MLNKPGFIRRLKLPQGIWGVLIVLGLCGCASSQPTIVDLPVFTKPTITIPERPVLRGITTGDYNDVLNGVEMDEADLVNYSIELENILHQIQGN